MTYVQCNNGLYYTDPIWYGKTCKGFAKVDSGTVIGIIETVGGEEYARRKWYEEMEKMDGALKIEKLIYDDRTLFPPQWNDLLEAKVFEVKFVCSEPVCVPDYFAHCVDHIDLLTDECIVWTHEFPARQVLGYIKGEIEYPLLEQFFKGMSRIKIKNKVMKQVGGDEWMGFLKLRKVGH